MLTEQQTFMFNETPQYGDYGSNGVLKIENSNFLMMT
jgi:hypothetical protein